MISSSELKKIFAIFFATICRVIVLKADYVLYSTNFFSSVRLLSQGDSYYTQDFEKSYEV